MTTKELSLKTGIPPSTIRRYAPELDGIPVGGRHGYEFPEDAPKWLLALLRKTRGGAQWHKFHMCKTASTAFGKRNK